LRTAHCTVRSRSSDVAQLRTHLVVLGLIALVVAVFYAKVTGAWFCGYDDFTEAHRAAFDDSANPVRIFTTTHNMQFMYRPVTSALQYVTWTTFHHSPLAFRLRNLLMHLLSVGMLYGIVWLIAQSRLVAAGSALLFGLQPMANETIVVAIWTNATAYAMFFSSFFFYLVSLRMLGTTRNWRIPLVASLILAFVALFTYEPTIAIFALMAGYLYVCKARHASPPRAYLRWLWVGMALELAVFFIARHLVITQAAPWNSLSSIFRNAFMYSVALVLPIDFVLANAVVGTPLPSEMQFNRQWIVLALLLVFALCAVALALARSGAVKARFSRADWPSVLFITGAIPVAVLPLLLFRDHPSEHDLYPSAAFYSALVCVLLWQMTRSRTIYGAAVLTLALSFGCATAVRNDRVADCGAIAQRILSQLPVTLWKQGTWHIRLATVPGETLSEPYGAYNDYGLHALETEKGMMPGATNAVQIASKNLSVTVDVVNESTILTSCKKRDTCFWVSPSGVVTDAVPVQRASTRNE
jgi:hypothetical protein